VVQEKPVSAYTSSNVTKLIISGDNRTYFMGCENGEVFHLAREDLSIVGRYGNKDDSAVRAIWASSNMFIVSHESGALEIYK
jgi:hypothetical protein